MAKPAQQLDWLSAGTVVAPTCAHQVRFMPESMISPGQRSIGYLLIAKHRHRQSIQVPHNQPALDMRQMEPQQARYEYWAYRRLSPERSSQELTIIQSPARTHQRYLKLIRLLRSEDQFAGEYCLSAVAFHAPDVYPRGVRLTEVRG